MPRCSTCSSEFDNVRPHVRVCEICADNEIEIMLDAGDPSVGIQSSGVRIVGDLPPYDDLKADGVLEDARETLARAVGEALLGEPLLPSSVQWAKEQRLAVEAEDTFWASQAEEADHA